MSNPLFVPVDLDVLVVNPGLLNASTFRWWKYTYASMKDSVFQSPEPGAFQGECASMTTGVYLHWDLPVALRSATKGTTDFPLVPNRWLVVRVSKQPGGTNMQKAWVIESDCPVPGAASSLFMVNGTVVQSWAASSEPNRKQAAPIAVGPNEPDSYFVSIGNPFPQTGWSEQAANIMFLTAVAPGNTEFSAYMPHNQNVFSFYDSLSDVAAPATVSYMVTGWYSDTANDIVTIPPKPSATFEEILNALNWTLQGITAQTPSADSSLYTGMAFGLNWNSDTSAPTPQQDQLTAISATPNITVSVGNTGVDAFTTLVGTQLQQLGHYQDTESVIELLRAFQYDVLQMLNTVGGDAQLDELVRDNWFASRSGGVMWAITGDGSNNGQSSGVVITPAEQAWLLALNQNQVKLNQALDELYSLQWQLCSAWWKYWYLSATAQQMLPHASNVYPVSSLAPFLDPTQPNNLVTPVIDQLNLINTLAANGPLPSTTPGLNAQDAYLAGIATFASSKGIGTGKVLKSVPLPRYWTANNPNIVISGVEPSAAANPNSSLAVRNSGQLITGFTVDSKQITAAGIGSVIAILGNLQAMPSSINSIYQEFCLLDPTNAPLIATTMSVPAAQVSAIMNSQPASAYTGILPSNSQAMITQQVWNPLFLEWQVLHTPVPFEYIQNPATGVRTRNWSFNGSDYDMKPNTVGLGALSTIGGRSLLSPHLQFTFGARLNDFVNKYGASQPDLSELYKEIDTADGWKFLAQELVYFNDFMSQRSPLAFRKPNQQTVQVNGKNIAWQQLMGFDTDPSQPQYDTPSSVLGQVNSIPAVSVSSASLYPFHGIRGGQFYFSRLYLYDKFGRVLDLIDFPGKVGADANNFPLVVDKALSVSTNLTPLINSPFQMPPRIMQGARLDMRLVSQLNNGDILNLADNVNPVCGWVISNHLDNSISIFAPDGSSFGEILLIQPAQGALQAQWSAPIHNNAIATIADISSISPNMGAFVSAMQGINETSFNTFIQVIDSTLWTTDPLGQRSDQNLSVYMGRPLAMVRMQLQFMLNGEAQRSCDWPTPVSAPVTDPNTPDYTTSNFSIRFGDLEAREDGVIGYFENMNYAKFNSTATPLSSQSYVSQIGPLNGQDGNYINLPFDGTTSEFITLLVDPRASIHAFTGILPIAELAVPSQFVDGPLSNMEVSFRIGPTVSRIAPPITANDINPPYPNSIDMLPMAEKNGAWSWWENTVVNPGQANQSETWQGYNLNDANTGATLSDTPAVVVEGYLQFATNLKPDNNN